jgi:hypothetical protein
MIKRVTVQIGMDFKRRSSLLSQSKKNMDPNTLGTKLDDANQLIASQRPELFQKLSMVSIVGNRDPPRVQRKSWTRKRLKFYKQHERAISDIFHQKQKDTLYRESATFNEFSASSAVFLRWSVPA